MVRMGRMSSLCYKNIGSFSVNDSDDAYFCGYASVETVDRDGDIVRVSGMELDVPEGTRLKVFGVPHKLNAVNPDNTPAIVGTVVDWYDGVKEIKGKTYPAKLFRAEYASDESGITDYAKKMRGLMRKGVLDSFSVGFEIVESKPLKNGRLDITKSKVFELSVVPVPANKYATIVKSLAKELGDDVDAIACLEQRQADLCKAFDEVRQHIDGVVESLKKDFSESMKSLVQDIESLMVAMRYGDGGHRDKSVAGDDVDLGDIRDLLDGFLEKVTRK